MNINATTTNATLDAQVEAIWMNVLEGDKSLFDYDNYTTDEITLIMAKIAAKAATYASDAINF